MTVNCRAGHDPADDGRGSAPPPSGGADPPSPSRREWFLA